MHRLDLTPAQRTHYESVGALSVSASGHEVLLGLTRQESEHVARCSAAAPGTLSEPDRLRYAGLLVRHEQARLKEVSFAAGSKDESRLG